MTDAVYLSVRLTPRASQDQITGMVDIADGRQAIAARVRAVPENGKANTALVRLIAKFLEVPKSRVEIVTGTKSRLKTLRIDGDRSGLTARIATIGQPDNGENQGKKS